MNRVEIYEKSVDILLTAYNEGNLEHSSCLKCAVGNLLSKPLGEKGFDLGVWTNFFYTASDGVQRINSCSFVSEEKEEMVKETILSYGYSFEELSKIEHTFEMSLINRGRASYNYHTTKNVKKGQFLGLSAVLDLLKEIHSTPESIVAQNQEKLENIYNNFTNDGQKIKELC